MIEKLVDWATLKFPAVYRWRKQWCEKRHQWTTKTLVDGQIWERSECQRCGFWEDIG